MTEPELPSPSPEVAGQEGGEDGAGQERSLEYWLSRATDPYVGDAVRTRHLTGFLEQLNQELEGPQIATRLLAHKIQSPFEVEAVHALDALDACMKNCGLRFHQEVSKFRFLNELIRILSPKYLGAQTSERVKQRAIELLYGWRRSMPHMGKIAQAYDMLKHQGIIVADPVYMDSVLEAEPPPPVPEPRTATFEDQEKSRLLSDLLRSKRPEDLVAANRLIKSMVKAEDQKMEKMAKRGGDLENAVSNARLLVDMVAQFTPLQPSQQDIEVMKDLVSSLISVRPSLYRYAGEAAEGEEEALARVLAANDEVSKAIDEYKAKVEPYAETTASSAPSSSQQPTPKTSNVQNLLDGLDLSSEITNSASHFSISSDDVGMIGGLTPVMNRKPVSAPDPPPVASKDMGSALDDLLGGGMTPPASTPTTTATVPPDLEALMASVKSAQAAAVAQAEESAAALPPDLLSDRCNQSAGLGSLDALSDSLISASLGKTSAAQTQRSLVQQRQKVPLRDLTPTAPSPVSPLSPETSPAHQRQAPLLSPPQNHASPIPSQGGRDPLRIVDKKGIRVVAHVAGNKVASGIGVLVLHISSSLSQPISELELRLEGAAKELGLRSEALSARSLPPFNPILPPAAVTQIVYLQLPQPQKGGVEVDFNLDFEVEGAERSMAGSFQIEASHFPS